jgi:archaeal type IV pilus assembly protein PilA
MTIVKNDAVSPVIGVLLMLVVTIIIAAVVSGFAGSLVSNQKAAPTASIEAHINNDGTGNSFFMLKVLSVSEPIPTRDLKIVVNWVNGTGYSGNATCTPNSGNLHYTSYPSASYTTGSVPNGFGPGVGTGTYDKQFGNYTWTTGTTMTHWPPNYGYPAKLADSKRYEYWSGWTNYISNGGTEVDAHTAFLGQYWNTLRPGDVVNIKVFHTPSGKVIINKDVKVEG